MTCDIGVRARCGPKLENNRLWCKSYGRPIRKVKSAVQLARPNPRTIPQNERVLLKGSTFKVQHEANETYDDDPCGVEEIRSYF